MSDLIALLGLDVGDIQVDITVAKDGEDGLAREFQDGLALFVAFVGAAAVLSRTLVDFRYRFFRDPAYLHHADEEDRTRIDDVRTWVLWRATLLGGLFGFAVATFVLALDRL